MLSSLIISKAPKFTAALKNTEGYHMIFYFQIVACVPDVIIVFYNSAWWHVMLFWWYKAGQQEESQPQPIPVEFPGVKTVPLGQHACLPLRFMQWMLIPPV